MSLNPALPPPLRRRFGLFTPASQERKINL